MADILVYPHVDHWYEDRTRRLLYKLQVGKPMYLPEDVGRFLLGARGDILCEGDSSHVCRWLRVQAPPPAQVDHVALEEPPVDRAMPSPRKRRARRVKVGK